MALLREDPAGGPGEKAEEKKKEKKEAPLDPRKRRKKAEAAEEKEADGPVEPPGTSCVVLEWTSGVVDDLVADSVAAIVCQCCVGPWALLSTHEPHHHAHNSTEPLNPRETTQQEDAAGLRQGALHTLAAVLRGRYGVESVILKDDSDELRLAVAPGELCVVRSSAAGLSAAGDRFIEVQALIDRLVATHVLTPVLANLL